MQKENSYKKAQKSQKRIEQGLIRISPEIYLCQSAYICVYPCSIPFLCELIFCVFCAFCGYLFFHLL